jgi:hypothetical protein
MAVVLVWSVEEAEKEAVFGEKIFCIRSDAMRFVDDIVMGWDVLSHHGIIRVNFCVASIGRTFDMFVRSLVRSCVDL